MPKKATKRPINDNPSERGFTKEREIAAKLRELCDYSQKFNYHYYEIDKDSICTSLKVYIANEEGMENDVNFLLRRRSKVVRWLNKKLLITDTENVAIQSKDFGGNVPTDKVTKDITHALMTHNLGFNLKANTFIVTQSSGDFLLESKLKAEYHVKIINADDLSDYEVQKDIGANSIAWSPYNEATDKWSPKNLEIGKLTLLDDGHSFWKGLKLANFIHVDCIGNEDAYEKVRAPLHVMDTYMNPEYYAYLASNGIGPKAEKFLERVNGLCMTPDKFYELIEKRTFFDKFDNISYDYNFGRGRVVVGEVEDSLLNHFEALIDNPSNKVINEKNVINAISTLVNHRPVIRV